MYVCICNAVTERQIEAQIADGADSFEQLQQQLQVATCCGSCRDAAEACLARSESRCNLTSELTA